MFVIISVPSLSLRFPAGQMEPLVQQAKPDPVEQALGDGHHDTQLIVRAACWRQNSLGSSSKYATLSRTFRNLPPTLSVGFLACQ